MIPIFSSSESEFDRITRYQHHHKHIRIGIKYYIYGRDVSQRNRDK